MNEQQNLSMLNNDTQNRKIIQCTEYRQNSVKQESLHNFDIRTQQEVKLDALELLKSYEKIDQAFPINMLKDSVNLRVKKYKLSSYYGELVNGKKNGLGIMFYQNGRIYEGQWKDDTRSGYGAEKFPNGCFYKGQFGNGKPNGVGSYTWPNGQHYDGQWLTGFQHGSGMWRGPKGDSYIGQWKFGKPYGHGVHTWPNGDTYQGEFRQCLKHGQGIQKFSNGDCYKGYYVNGKPSGYGEYYWSNGSYFKGHFLNGFRDGKGIWKKGQGKTDHYEGNFKNDKKWGFGTFTWISGAVYKGNYVNDVRQGFGQMFWKNGTYYKGMWVNGIQHGEGQLYVPGQGFKKGRFDHNVIVQVYSQDIIQKKKQLKTSKNIKTGNSSEKRQVKTTFRTRQNSKFKQSFKSENKKDYLSVKQKCGSKKLFKEDNPKQNRPLSKFQPKKIQRLFFTSNETQTESRQNDTSMIKNRRFNTTVNQDSNTSKLEKANTKQRLLHASFYLHKLNKQHNDETMKNLKKMEIELRPTILFKGRFQPSQF